MSTTPCKSRAAGSSDENWGSRPGCGSHPAGDRNGGTYGQTFTVPGLSTIRGRMEEVFAENILAKVCKVAVEALPSDADSASTRPTDRIVTGFPEYCPQSGEDYGKYRLREPEFWTCGFFPGTLYLLLERAIRFPHSLGFDRRAPQPTAAQIRHHLWSLCRKWSEPLHGMAARTDTHDLGFIISPALRLDWELTFNERSLASIVRAANSLASRYVPAARAIRSWDAMRKKDIEIVGLEDNFLVIIDGMCNLDLLYYAAAHSGDDRLADIATTHARTVITTHLRREEAPGSPRAMVNGRRYTGQLYSTFHVVNMDPRTGEVKRRLTAQGYADASTWARGQAWAILGFAQTYMWTKDPEFLDAACGCAEYFLHRLNTAPACVDVVRGMQNQDNGDVREEEKLNESTGSSSSSSRTTGRYVPLWDFDAPIEDTSNPTRDSSAGVIAANGMLILSQALAGADQAELSTQFRDAALRIVRDTLDFALAEEKAKFRDDGDGLVAEDVVEGRRFDALLKFGTANNNAYAKKRYANHGLVYGDYYLVEFGNRLLRMGLA
ncbi:hypothetical protein VTG60DRAFT_1188 [Thermothelomyces hinnuleus]